jgi:hypothetical protein
MINNLVDNLVFSRYDDLICFFKDKEDLDQFLKLGYRRGYPKKS